MRNWFGAVVLTCVVAGVPWISMAEDKPAAEEDKPAGTTSADEDTKFQESLNSLGLSAGYAGKCSEKNPETVETILGQALAAANQLAQLFGTDAAFRFVFYAGLGGAGAKMDVAKCPQYIADWSDFVKKHPELVIRETKESK